MTRLPWRSHRAPDLYGCPRALHTRSWSSPRAAAAPFTTSATALQSSWSTRNADSRLGAFYQASPERRQPGPNGHGHHPEGSTHTPSGTEPSHLRGDGKNDRDNIISTYKREPTHPRKRHSFFAGKYELVRLQERIRRQAEEKVTGFGAETSLSDPMGLYTLIPEKDESAELFASRSQPPEALWFREAMDPSQKWPVLAISGLSTNLRLTDFLRLIPSEMASWQSVLHKVVQLRHPSTLEPLGRYHLSFGNMMALRVYKERFKRAYKLSQTRAHSPTGLWEHEAALRKQLGVPAGENPAVIADTFTLAPGTQVIPRLVVQKVDYVPKTRFPLPPLRETLDPAEDNSDLTADQPDTAVDQTAADEAENSSMSLFEEEDDPPEAVTSLDEWKDIIRDESTSRGYGAQGVVVMLEVYPPMLDESHLAACLRADERQRGHRWRVGSFFNVAGPLQDTASKDMSRVHKMAGRFVTVCADEGEARRFRRAFNSRVVRGAGAKPGEPNRLRVSLVYW